MDNPIKSFIIISFLILFQCIARIALPQHPELKPTGCVGIDIACGAGGQGFVWYRYLLTAYKDGTRLYYQGEYSPRWYMANYLPDANKIVSYKSKGCGNYAVCADYKDDIYISSDGGLIWEPCGFPREYNRSFASVEILNWPSPGLTIFVGTEPDNLSASSYYTTDGGRSWHILGSRDGDPMDGKTVNDIESMAGGELSAGTTEGIFRHDSDYRSPWRRAAFPGENVTAIDNIELGITQQVAAVGGIDGAARLYYTSDAWDKDVREICVKKMVFPSMIYDLSVIYWGESRISCYLCTDKGAMLVTFDDSDPSKGESVDLGNIEENLTNRPISAVDYAVEYDNGHATAIVIVTGPDAVYEIREYRSNPLIIDSITVSDISRGLPSETASDLKKPRN